MTLSEQTLVAAPANPWNRLLRKSVLERLAALPAGSLEIYEHGHRVPGPAPASDTETEAPVRLDVLDPDFYRRVALGGSIGAGESYMEGQWEADNLTRLIQIFSRDLQTVSAMEEGLARAAGWIDRAIHLLQSNTKSGSRRNIAKHYDLGNDFFRLFLDPTMMYSSALFPTEKSTLEEASLHKLDVVCRKLDLQPGDTVVEIGTGWGGFASHAVRNYGCSVTTTTVSQAQFDYATARIRAEGLEDRVEILLCDYRDLGHVVGRRFDKLVSIEMIEAVGHRLLPKYFSVCSDLLKQDGLGVIQAIVIADDRYESYRKSVDFIQRYIFPGGLLPSISSITRAMARTTDLKLFHLEDITPHYAKTLHCWRERFLDNLDAVEALGLPQTFQRMWDFYLCYCEAGFMERVVGDVQIVLTKPLSRRDPIPSAL